MPSIEGREGLDCASIEGREGLDCAHVEDCKSHKKGGKFSHEKHYL